jgi:hypothetical protein
MQIGEEDWDKELTLRVCVVVRVVDDSKVLQVSGVVGEEVIVYELER